MIRGSGGASADPRPAVPTGLPDSLAARPLDPRRRLPVPYVSEHPTRDGIVVDFTAINADRAEEAGRDRRCSLCGTGMGYRVAFLGGPASAANRLYSDPPGHPECLRAAVTLCPYIAIGRARRATARRLQPGTVTPPGFADTKPAEWILGITRNYRMLRRRGTLVFRPAPFTSIERWTYDSDGHLLTAPPSVPLP